MTFTQSSKAYYATKLRCKYNDSLMYTYVYVRFSIDHHELRSKGLATLWCHYTAPRLFTVRRLLAVFVTSPCSASSLIIVSTWVDLSTLRLVFIRSAILLSPNFPSRTLTPYPFVHYSLYVWEPIDHISWAWMTLIYPAVSSPTNHHHPIHEWRTRTTCHFHSHRDYFTIT